MDGENVYFYEKSPVLKKIQEIQYEMLVDLKNFCEKNGITYFLIGGTALGARRHEGFIPWDDDIDVGMLRQDYELFKKMSTNKYVDGYFIQCPDTEKSAPFPYIKIRKEGTRVFEKPFQNIPMNHGVYLDVFPFDRVPESRIIRKTQFYVSQILSKFYVRKKVYPQYPAVRGGVDIFKLYAKKIIYYAAKFIPDRVIVDSMSLVMNLYNDKRAEEYSCLFFPVFMVESFRTDVLFPLGEAMFEGGTFPVPGMLDVYLTTHYGEFMKLPPEDRRRGHDLDWSDVEL